MQQRPLWTKDFTLLWLTNFLMAIGFYFLLPTLPTYALKILEADKSQVGYIIGVYTFAALLIRPLAGFALDSFGRKKVYLWAMGSFALLMTSYFFAVNIFYLLVIRLIHGIAWGITTTGGGTIVADIIPAHRRGEGIGYFGLSMTAAMAIGPLLGVWILGENHFIRLFLASTLLVIAAFLLATLIGYPEPPLTSRSLNWHAFFDIKIVPLAFLMFFTTFVYGGIISFIYIYIEEIGIAKESSGLFFLVYALGLSLSRPFAGKMFDLKGPRHVTSLGFILLIAGFMVLAASSQIIGLLSAAVLMGFGNGIIWPTVQTMVINISEPQRRGVANSTLFSSLDLGIGGGSILLGWFADGFSLGIMYFVSALILVLPLVYFWVYGIKYYENNLKSGESNG